MVLGIVFQRRVVDTVKDLPPSDSRLNRGQTRFSSPCLLDLSLMSFNDTEWIERMELVRGCLTLTRFCCRS